MLDVRDYGAKADKQTNDAPAIQAAIEACRQAGGGTVYVPAGDYLSGTIRLYENIALYLDAGATLWTSLEPNDYELERQGGQSRGYLLMADDVENVAVLGKGTLRGEGNWPLGRYFGVPEHPPFRVGLLLFTGCKRVTLRDIRFLYCDAWTVHLKRCEDVVIDGITIFNDIRHINSDGIDPNSCKNVRISNCHIVAGDDCIVLKSTDPHPCENVVVTNCTLETTCTALKLGTESHGDFRDVHFSNCTIRNTSVGIGFYLKDGATIERVTFTNISIENLEMDPQRHVIYPIFIDIEKRNPDSRVGVIRDVNLDNLQICGGAGALIQGMPESFIQDLSLRNITMRVERGHDWSERSKAIGGRRTTSDERDTLYARKPSYLTLAYVKGLVMENIRVVVDPAVSRRYERSAVSIHRSVDGLIRNVAQSVELSDLPIVAIHDCDRVRVTE